MAFHVFTVHMVKTRAVSIGTVAAIALAAILGCGRAGPAGGHDRQERPSPAVLLSVAASTVDAAEELARQFEAQFNAKVKINAGASNALAAQIMQGAPADLFLSASPQWAENLEASGRAIDACSLLSNRLVVIVPIANPAQVHRIEDLAGSAVTKLAMAGENVPAGEYADQALQRASLAERLRGKIVRGHDVRAAVSFVARGEAEAGIVYATDVRSSSDVELAFVIDPALHERIVYALVLVNNQPANPAARKLYDFLRRPAAGDTFSQFGFVPISKAP